MYVLCWKKT